MMLTTHTDLTISPAKRQVAKALRTSRFNRSEIMREAWRLWTLARDVAKRPAFNGVAIEAAALAAGRRPLEAKQMRDTDYRERREVKGINSFGDAMRAVWATANRVADRAIKRAADDAAFVARQSAMTREERLAQDAQIIAAVAAFHND